MTDILTNHDQVRLNTQNLWKHIWPMKPILFHFELTRFSCSEKCHVIGFGLMNFVTISFYMIPIGVHTYIRGQ
jgi:hypothetical protein